MSAQLLQELVRLTVVARHAGRVAVLPQVLAATAARDHVVDGLRAPATVDAAEVVAPHQSRPGEWYLLSVGDAYVAQQPDHRWHLHHHGRRAQAGAGDVEVDDLGLLPEHQADGTPQRQGGEWFVSRVEE